MKSSKIALSCILAAGIFVPATANAQTVPLYRQQKTPTSYQQQNSNNNTSSVQGQLQITPTPSPQPYQGGYVQQNTAQSAPSGHVAGSNIPAAQAQYMSQARPQSQDILAMQGVRIAQLEDIIRALTGQLEQLNHKIAEQSQQLSIMAKDVNYRFKSLEQRSFSSNQGMAAKQPQQTMRMPIATNPAVMQAPRTTQQQPSIMRAGPSPWAQATARNGNNMAAQTLVAVAPAAPAPTDHQLYNDAYALLRNGDYEAAEIRLKDMLKKFPNSTLGGNAQYWLGETYYARKKYEQAAIAFADGYKKYSSSTKGPDNLLKLGLSMKALGKTEDACVALKAVETTFPDAPNAIKKRAQSEIAAAKCD